MKLAKKGIFVLLTGLVTVIFLELALQVTSWFSTDIDALLSGRPSTRINDRPDWMPALHHPEHDAKGFRNPSVPVVVPVVALGDSNTYGWGVKMQEAWPRQIERLGARQIYSMAYGGFGPVHLLALFDQALALKPKLVVLVFFSGNDLYDAYRLVYQDEQRLPLVENLKSSDPKVIAELRAIENDPEQTTRMAEIQSAINEFHTLVRGTGEPRRSRNERPSAVRTFVSQHLKLWGLLRAIRRTFDKSSGKRMVRYDYLNEEPTWETIRRQAEKNPEIYWTFDNPRVRTVFTLNYRLYGIDMRDPRIVEGFRISMDVFRAMQEKARIQGTNFLVMLWPTKELAFKELVYQHVKEVPEGYTTLIGNEELMWNRVRQFLERNTISYFDLLPTIRESLRVGDQIYSISPDSHMNRQGHLIVAERVLAELKSRGF